MAVGIAGNARKYTAHIMFDEEISVNSGNDQKIIPSLQKAYEKAVSGGSIHEIGKMGPSNFYRRPLSGCCVE